MRKLLQILLISIAPLLSLGQCPVKGDKNNAKFQHIDSLKNRSIPSNSTNFKITLDSILKPGNDAARWSSDNYVDIIGYVYDVKYGGAETCNCHSANKPDLDTHIEIVQDLKNSGPTKRMIVEINRYVKTNDTTLSYKYTRSLIGKKVEIRGFLFFDEEHKQNSYNCNPNGTNLWRATCVEIHPCFYIKEIK